MANTENDNDTATGQAVFGGGCFWCTEAVFQQLRGVTAVLPAYAGGPDETPPTYEDVCSGQTGFIEVVDIRFDPALVSYEDLLNVFFATHDPTTMDRQGHDVGSQYRSAIFWQDDAQRETAERVIASLNAQNVFGAPIVTRLYPPAKVWPAETYHREYFVRNPRQGYCHAVIAPKVAKFRKQFMDRLRA